MSARKIEQNKITQDESGVSLEHHEAYDDERLPSAEELSKLKSIDPSIVPWMMKMSEEEQKARITYTRRRMVVMFNICTDKKSKSAYK